MHSPIVAQVTAVQETLELLIDDYQQGRPIGHHIDVMRSAAADAQLMLREVPPTDEPPSEPPFQDVHATVVDFPPEAQVEEITNSPGVPQGAMMFGPFNTPMMQLLGGGQPAPSPEYRLPLQIAAAREIMGSFMKLRSFIANAGPQQDDAVPGDEWKSRGASGPGLSEDEERLYNSSLTTLRTWLEGLSAAPE